MGLKITPPFLKKKGVGERGEPGGSSKTLHIANNYAGYIPGTAKAAA